MLVTEFINFINDCLRVIGRCVIQDGLLELWADSHTICISFAIELCSLELVAFLIRHIE
jgi:hypothetical protein